MEHYVIDPEPNNESEDDQYNKEGICAPGLEFFIELGIQFRLSAGCYRVLHILNLDSKVSGDRSEGYDKRKRAI